MEEESGLICMRCGKMVQELDDYGLCFLCHSRCLDARHRLLDFNPMYIVGFSEPLKYHYDNTLYEYGDVPRRQDDERDWYEEDVNVVGGLERRERNIIDEVRRWW